MQELQGKGTRCWRLKGRVQGVGFRWFVRREALACGIGGDVRNLRDGSVEVRANGTREQLDRFLEGLRSGPPAARVDGIEPRPVDPDAEFDGFEIRTERPW